MTGNSLLLEKAPIELYKAKKVLDAYGKNATAYGVASGATLLAADITSAVDKHAQLQAEEQAIVAKQAEIDIRAEQALASIAKKTEKVKGAQAAAFAKAGVKLQGSALDVLAETEIQALNEKRIIRQEADYNLKRLSVAKAIDDVKLKALPVETALKLLGTASMSGSMVSSTAKLTSSVKG